MTPEQLEKFMRRAFDLGRHYQRQTDSDNWSENMKSDATFQNFTALVAVAKRELQGEQA